MCDERPKPADFLMYGDLDEQSACRHLLGKSKLEGRCAKPSKQLQVAVDCGGRGREDVSPGLHCDINIGMDRCGIPSSVSCRANDQGCWLDSACALDMERNGGGSTLLDRFGRAGTSLARLIARRELRAGRMSGRTECGCRGMANSITCGARRTEGRPVKLDDVGI